MPPKRKDNEKPELVNPKWVLRKILLAVRPLPIELRETVVALYSCGGYILKEDVEAGTIPFKAQATQSQLAELMNIDVRSVQRRLARLKNFNLVDWVPNRSHKANDYGVTLSYGIETPGEDPTDNRLGRESTGRDIGTGEPPVSHPSGAREPAGNPSEPTLAGNPPYASGRDAVGQPLIRHPEDSHTASNQPHTAFGTPHTASSAPHSGGSGSATGGELTGRQSVTTTLREDHFVETPSGRPGDPGPVVPSPVINAEESLNPIPVETAPPAQSGDVPARCGPRHKWPSRNDCRLETVCLRPGCGVTYGEWQYQRAECEGEREEATNA